MCIKRLSVRPYINVIHVPPDVISTTVVSVSGSYGGEYIPVVNGKVCGWLKCACVRTFLAVFFTDMYAYKLVCGIMLTDFQRRSHAALDH